MQFEIPFLLQFFCYLTHKIKRREAKDIVGEPPCFTGHAHNWAWPGVLNGRGKRFEEMATSNEVGADFGDLLSQFQCMGTTDRETLIRELFSVLDGQISRDQCAFILEMSNWLV